MKTLKILIVEDDELVAGNIEMVLKMLLTAATIFKANTVSYALDLLKKEKFSLITLDGKLLDGHGREVAKEMTEQQRLQTIAYSGDIKFLMECHNKGIHIVSKSDDMFAAFSKIISIMKLT